MNFPAHMPVHFVEIYVPSSFLLYRNHDSFFKNNKKQPNKQPQQKNTNKKLYIKCAT